MYKKISLLLISVFALCFGCNNTEVKSDAEISFAIEEYDFGEIPQGESVDFKFEFTNSGKTPLIINDVTTSCGCTAADWPKAVIKPEKSGSITVKFDAEDIGVFGKQITVSYNGKKSPIRLRIKGEVTIVDLPE